MSFNKALFLDRDGTIIEDCNGVLNVDDIIFKMGLKEFLLKALERGFIIIMITNQTAVSRGLTTYSHMKKINDILLNQIDCLVGSKVFSKVFICPYHPDAQIKRYRKDSYFRKPKPGMLIKAKEKLNLDLKNSIFVGDRVSDIVAGNIAGCLTVLLSGTNNSSKMINTDLDYAEENTIPDHKVDKLLDIISIMENLS